MLSGRIAPSLAKYAQLRYASYQPVLMQSITTIKLSTCSTGAEPSRFVATGVDYAPQPRNSNFITSRSYTTDQPKLPSKNEVQKMFFKITVIIWDLTWAVLMWTWSMFKNKIVYNSTVQSYWKNFNSKLEEARKN